MDIPTGEITSDYYQSRIRRMVELQRRWTGWVDSGLPLGTRTTSTSAATAQQQDGCTTGAGTTIATCGTSSRTVRRPVSALARSSGTRGERRHEPSRSGNSLLHHRLDVASSTTRETLHSSTGNGQNAHDAREHHDACTPLDRVRLEAAKMEASRVDASVLSSRIDLAAASTQSDTACTSDIAQYSQFGVSVDEVVSLKCLCDALSSLGGKQLSTSSSSITLSIERAVSALEAATHIFKEHPLFSYLFHVLSECLPRGMYSNPLPLLAEAALLPQPRTPSTGPSASTASVRGDTSPTVASGGEAGSPWVDWITTRAAQWSRICVPLGVVTKLFDVGRSECLSTSMGGSVPRSRSPPSETLGAKMFGALQGSAKGASRDPSPSGGGRRVHLRLSQTFVAWHQLTAACVERRKCVAVCSRGSRKGALLNAFTQWRCGTVVSLALRKSGHAERLHYVVQDDARKLEAADLEIRNLRRQRDTALCRIDQLIDDSRLAIAKAIDCQNGMVIDFRKPIIPTSQKSKIAFGTAEPLVSGCIYFQQQPQVPLIGRSASPRAASPHPDGPDTTGPLPTVPVQYSYDCGVERPADGVALPHAQNFRSFYRITVEGINEKQQQKVASAPADTLLRWVNDEVVAVCAQLIQVSADTVPSPHASTTGPMLSHGRSVAGGALRGSSALTSLPVDEFGVLGTAYLSYLKEWQEALQSWDNESATIRDERDPAENICISTADARSTRLPPHVVMPCHVHRPRDMCAFPFLYALLLFRACPRIIQLYGPATRDGEDGSVSGAPTTTLPAISLVEQIALLVKRTSSLKGLYALLQRAGVVQHLPLSVLENTATHDGNVGVALNQQLDAAHRLLLTRIRCLGMMVAEYEPFWKLTMRGVPYQQALTLQDVVVQRAGAHHSTELAASEVLVWVRAVLMSAEVPCGVVDNDNRSDDVSQSPSLGKSSATPRAADSRSVRPSLPSFRQRFSLSTRGNLLNQSLGSSIQDDRPPAALAAETAAVAVDSQQCRFLGIDNLSESFGEGLELLWIVVEQLTPVSNAPFTAYAGVSSASARSIKLVDNAKAPNSDSRLASKERNAAVVHSEKMGVTPEDVAAQSGMDASLSSVPVSPRPSLLDYDALSIKEVATVLCASLRDVFGCHVPQILFDELYLATPSLKLMFLTCLYCKIHATALTGISLDATINGTKAAGSVAPCDEKSRSVVAKDTVPERRPKPKATPSASPDKGRKPAAAYAHPSVYASITTQLLLQRYALQETQACLLIEFLKSHNELLYHLFLKYAVLASPPVHINSNDGASASASTTLNTSLSPSPSESMASTISLSYIGVEMIARDLLYGFSFHGTTQTPSYLTSAEVASATVAAIRQCFVDTVRCNVEDFPTGRTGGSLGAALMGSSQTIPCHQFGEFLVHLCWLISPAVIRYVQKQQQQHAKLGKHTAVPLVEETTLTLIHRLEVIVGAAEECFAQHRLQCDGNVLQQRPVGPTSKGDRDALASSFLDVDRVRTSMVVPVVFRDKAQPVVSMFVQHSHWKSAERWHVLSERKMTRTLFLAFCEAAGILDVPSTSAMSVPSFSSPDSLGKRDPLQGIACSTAQLGWVPAILDTRTTPAALYARVSPIHDLLSPPRGAPAVVEAPGARKRKPEKLAAQTQLHPKVVSMSKGLRVNLLRSIPLDLAVVTFQVVALSRASPGALALDRLLHQLIPTSAAPTHRSATMESDGYCEEDGFTNPDEPAISYAGFCEVLAMLAQQCLPLPWISHAARISLFVDLLFGILSSEQ